MSATTAFHTLPILPPLAGLPHPHIRGPLLFLSHIPSHVAECEVLRELSSYGFFQWFCHGWCPSGQRLKPDVFYRSMSWNVDVIFASQGMVEKALVCFQASSFATIHGIVVSLSPNQTGVPPLDSRVTARYITPVFHLDFEAPTTQDIYDLVRQGGPIRFINLVRTCSQWSCRVEWWYEEEAQKFAFDFKAAGSMMGIWTLSIIREEDPKYPVSIPDYSPLQITPPLPYMPLPPFPSYLPAPPLAYHTPFHYAEAYPQAASVSGMRPRALSTELPRPLRMVLNQKAHSAPMPTIPLPHVPNPRVPRPPSDWREIIGVLPTGEKGVIGVGDQYGNKLLHKPGQHTVWREGSERSSGKAGWVDLCNLRVKGLDADINDTYLRGIFEEFDGFKSSAVRRETRGNPKGVGFVSFDTVEQTKTAMDSMQGQKCGSKKIVITYHEPTRLKPEKVAANRPG